MMEEKRPETGRHYKPSVRRDEWIALYKQMIAELEAQIETLTQEMKALQVRIGNCGNPPREDLERLHEVKTQRWVLQGKLNAQKQELERAERNVNRTRSFVCFPQILYMPRFSEAIHPKCCLDLTGIHV